MKSAKEIQKENRVWADDLLTRVTLKMESVTLRLRGVIAGNASVDTGRRSSDSPSSWTSGFFAGLNWLMYSYTKNEEYRRTAEGLELMLDAGLSSFEKLHHDVGFMWHISAGASYRLTGNSDSRLRNLYAAATLSSRYVHGAGFIRAWNNAWSGNCVDGWSIIDCLMNLPILFWASDVLGDDRFARIAVSHADMALAQHLRPDGSVAHIVEHDRETGEPVATHAGQGYAIGSSWSRGQSWAVYGFVIAYLHTNDERYLNAAKRVANYFIANCCDDWLPRVDFRAPSTPVYYDTTAGACAACGMIELAKLLPENEGGMYMNAAINMLSAMTDKFCNFDPECDYILGGGTARYPIPGVVPIERAGLHIPIIYGDFFYVEALLKLAGSDFNPWLK